MSKEDRSERLLVLMPTRKDAERAVAAFGQSNLSCVPCTDLDDLCREIKHGAGAALIIEEALLTNPASLKQTLDSDPFLSGFPLIVLVREGRKNITLPDDLDLNVTLVERPVRMVTLKSVVNTALRHRRRQYQLHAVLQDLERANEELEARVKLRTARLQETIGELESYSYSISHDMRAPLRAMQAYSKVLSDELGPRLDETHRRYLTRITTAANRMDKLITDVLAYSRLSRGDIDLTPVDLDHLVAEITYQYPSLQNAEIDIAKNLGIVRAAEALLTQAIANLLTNAVKFVPPGVNPVIRVWSETLPPPSAPEDGPPSRSTQPSIRLFIQDNGVGIDPKDQERIFSMFIRVYSDKDYEGTGIGLSIVKKAIERMDGSIGLQSELGKGSTFWIDLPAA
jgi:signal transduction histidine kinase